MGRHRKFSADKLSKTITQSLDAKLRNALNTGVKPLLETTMKEVIKSSIYDHYEPSIYLRREENGGLLDDNNIKAFTEFKSGNSYTYTRGWKYNIKLVNVAQPAPLSTFAHNLFYNNATSTLRSAYTISKEKDLLYYWKDQGLVYNYFHDPNFDRYGRAANLNQQIRDRTMRSGKISKIIFNEFKSEFGARIKRSKK